MCPEKKKRCRFFLGLEVAKNVPSTKPTMPAYPSCLPWRAKTASAHSGNCGVQRLKSVTNRRLCQRSYTVRMVQRSTADALVRLRPNLSFSCCSVAPRAMVYNSTEMAVSAEKE